MLITYKRMPKDVVLFAILRCYYMYLFYFTLLNLSKYKFGNLLESYRGPCPTNCQRANPLEDDECSLQGDAKRLCVLFYGAILLILFC